MALSPTALPFHANFSVMVSPSIKSPHVQFVATPQLVATYATHSSEQYDRAPIKVSPNPLELPRRGDRCYSPSMVNFKLADPPKPKAAVQKRLESILRSSQACASPAITEFEDPRSPKQPIVAAQHVRFASFAPPPRLPRRDLSKSMSSYPRSPYPSATEQSFEEQQRGRTEGNATEALLRSRSLSDSTAPRRAKVKGAPAPIKTPRLPSAFTPIASPLQQSFGPPTTAGLQRSHKPAPLALEPKDDASALSDAFWEAVSLGGETPMVTAPEYPSSEVGGMELEEVDFKSPALAALKSPPPSMPMLMFGNSLGEIWSPSFKQPAASTPRRESLLRHALMSPAKVAFRAAKRSDFAAPSPNDPFAAFPSFAAALSMAPSDSSIAYPAPIATMA